jgi:RNA ligase (TIGR02306 family)
MGQVLTEGLHPAALAEASDVLKKAIEERNLRKLVSVRRIAALTPIEGADLIETATVDGWKLVVKKGEFNVGDLCAYFEIDCFLPESDPRYAFLMNKGVREFEGVRGHRLRTVKLRGQISQGLALPINLFFEDFIGSDEDEGQELSEFFTPGTELTKLLGIKKWEAAIPAELAGQVKGVFPSFIRKTDQERCQNLINEIFVENKGARYEVSTKLDGSSVTIYHRDGELGVCSRNLELKVNDENKDNALVRALFDNLFNVSLPAIGRNLALQGEIMGPGIQGNREQLKKAQFFIFDIFDIDRGEYLAPAERHEIVERLRATWPQVEHVPVMYTDISLEELGIEDVDGLLQFTEGPSLNHAIREGLVFKRVNGGFSFKAISNTYLAKEKD